MSIRQVLSDADFQRGVRIVSLAVRYGAFSLPDRASRVIYHAPERTQIIWQVTTWRRSNDEWTGLVLRAHDPQRNSVQTLLTAGPGEIRSAIVCLQEADGRRFEHEVTEATR